MYILKNDETKGVFMVKAKNTPGTVNVIAKSNFTLFPSSINVEICDNIVEVKH